MQLPIDPPIKISKLGAHITEVDEIIELPLYEYFNLAANPYVPRPIIDDNTNNIYVDEDTAHCLLVLSEAGADGILVYSEGTGNAWYTHYVENAKGLVADELDVLAHKLLAGIEPEPVSGHIHINYSDIEDASNIETAEGCYLEKEFRRVLSERLGRRAEHLTCFADPVIVVESNYPSPQTDPTKYGLLWEGWGRDIFIDNMEIGLDMFSHPTDQGGPTLEQAIHDMTFVDAYLRSIAQPLARNDIEDGQPVFIAEEKRYDIVTHQDKKGVYLAGRPDGIAWNELGTDYHLHRQDPAHNPFDILPADHEVLEMNME